MANKDMNTATNIDEIKENFWEAMSDSPFVIVGLNNDNGHSIPMTAQLDKDANSAVWFFTSKDNRLAKGGSAMAQYAAKDHKIFACIRGTISEEADKSRIDDLWNNAVSAWYDKGKDDPSLLLLRFDLLDAEIWEADPGVKGIFKLVTGMKMKGDEMGEHAKVSL